MPKLHNILLLAFPNGQLLDIAGPLQMFAGANDELSRPMYRIEIAAPVAGPFPTSSGVRLVADAAFAEITNRRLARTGRSSRSAAGPACAKSLRVDP
jgi:transcriptional regulator GlxA family with amidase domain